MSLRDFFTAHRDELLRACQSDQDAGASIEQLAQELCELLELPASSSAAISSADALVGDSPVMRQVKGSIEKLARRSRLPVLFLGELGSGKRHSARFLHSATYPDGELFELHDTEQLPVLERKLTALRTRSSALAIGGLSVFVNELSEAPKPVQATLAKLLRERALPLRLMASSRIPLAHACREGSLRSDVAVGLSTTIELPNLRDRLADLRALLMHFESQNATRGGTPLAFSDAAFSLLAAHAWPGNLIELSQVVKRLQALGAPGAIEPHHLTELRQRPSGMVLSLPPSGVDLANLERELLRQALVRTDNNRSQAARLLGLTRDQIRYRLSKIEPSASEGE